MKLHSTYIALKSRKVYITSGSSYQNGNKGGEAVNLWHGGIGSR